MNKILLTWMVILGFSCKITAVKSSSSEFIPITSVNELYFDSGLNSLMSFVSFTKVMEGYKKYSNDKPIVAICDFSKPSNQVRFFVVDLQNKKVLIKSYVAHGKNSGDLMATHFSNIPESLQSSLGFYRVGAAIHNVKHGLSLELDGLEPGLNDNARIRGIIMHGANYVSESFVNNYGYTGKSFGCPALPNALMPAVVSLLKDGALLYICNE